MLRKFLPTLNETIEAAKIFSQQLHPGQVIYLQGPLGAGKTTFVQGLLKAWGYAGQVTSPTYTLVESYGLPQFTVVHFDFYRLKHPQELAFIGIKEYFTPTSIVFIEWPERAGTFIPAADWSVEFSYKEEGRQVKVERFYA